VQLVAATVAAAVIGAVLGAILGPLITSRLTRSRPVILTADVRLSDEIARNKTVQTNAGLIDAVRETPFATVVYNLNCAYQS